MDDFITSVKNEVFISSKSSEQEIFCKYLKIINEEEIVKFMAIPIEMKKSITVAKISLNKGKLKLEEKLYLDALGFFNDSICFAPQKTEEFIKAIDLRSFANFELGNYKDSLLDTNIILRNSFYPKDKLCVVYFRKTKCLLKLGFLDDAKKAFKKGKKYFDLYHSQCEIGDVNIVRDNIKKEIDNFNCNDNDDNTVFSNIHSIASVFPYMSNSGNLLNLESSKNFLLKYSSEKGRCVIAKRNIKKGDVLFIEEPFAITLPDNNDRFEKYCGNCFQQSFAFIPCKLCISALYCSEICKNKSWESRHKWECIGLRKQIITRKLTLFLNMVFEKSKLGISDMIPGDEKVFKGNASDMATIDNLITHRNKIPWTIIKNFSLVAIWLVMYLKNFTNYFEWLSKKEKTPKNQLYEIIGGWFLKYFMCSTCNENDLYNIIVSKTNEFETQVKEKLYATAIYLATNMLNHDCTPNSIASYHNATKVVRASKNINKGEEITISYLISLFSNLYTLEERDKLLNGYCIDCTCQLCLDQNKYTKWICFRCKERTKLVMIFITEFVVCDKCKTMYPVEKYIKNDALISFYMKLARDTKNIYFLDQIPEKAKNALHPSDPIFYNINVNYRLYYETKGNLVKQLLYRRENIEKAKYMHGETCLLYLKEIVEFSYILIKYVLALKNCKSKNYSYKKNELRITIQQSLEILSYYTNQKHVQTYIRSISSMLQKYDINLN